MSAKKKPIDELLAVGLQGVFHPDPTRKDGPRYQVWIRGWQEGHHVFLELKMDQSRSLVFREMGPCVVRFLRDGLACAFDAQLVDWQVTRQNPYFRVSWPSTVNYLSVRKHQRIEVDLSCTLNDERGNEFHGTIRDLSAAGMGVISLAQRDASEKLRISCKLPDGSVISKAAVTVRSTRQTNDGHFLGLELAASEQDTRDVLDFYITSTLARLRQANDTDASIVIIDPDDKGVEASCKMLERLGYEVTHTENLVDGFFRLRLLRPHALAINHDLGQSGTDAFGACQIIRDVKGFEDLPIFIYGGQGVNKEKSVENGATDYFSDLSESSGFPQSLAQHITSGDEKSDESGGQERSAQVPQS